MCGIVVALGEGARQIEELAAMIEHRGVRRRTCSIKGGALAHARLPIVGLDADYDQPLHRGLHTVAFVGELLDYQKIQPGAACDAHVVADLIQDRGVYAFEEVGSDWFGHVVVANNRTGVVDLVCDYLGQKPLYYRTTPHVVAASEPAVVAAAAPTTPDEVYLASVQKWGYCPDVCRTPYAEVRRVAPGQCVTVSRGGVKDIRQVDRLSPVLAHDVPAAVRDLVEKAVERRVLSSDVPVAALVSGGLDSSVTYALARRHRDVRLYHVDNGEAEHLDALLAHLGDAPEVTHLDYSEDAVDLERALGYMQEPLDLGSLVPQVALSDAIGETETVCLTGDGADELFGGYSRAQRYDSQASDVWHELVAWHLPRLDRVMMRNRVEVRSPFLERRVVEHALALPWSWRKKKEALREAFRDVLPAKVIDAEKRALKSRGVRQDREARSVELVTRFRELTWGPS